MAKPSELLLWGLLSLFPTQSLCGSMAAWWTDLGPAFAMQNASTGLLTHTLCHSNSTPIFPVDPPVAFETTYAPRNGTSLAGAGWWDGSTTWASLFYQNNNDDLVNAAYMCDFATGKYKLVESAVISDREGTPAVHPQTGLSVALLGEQEGYRVYFHDREKALQSLKFTQVESWSYGGPISSSTDRSGMAIHSMFSGVRNVSVITPRDSSNIEVSRLNIDGAYHISTFPTPLSNTNTTSRTNATNFPFADNTESGFTDNTQSGPPIPAVAIRATDTSASDPLKAWSGNPAAVGLAIDTHLTRHLFYVGTDRAPHHVAAFVTGTTESGWRAQPDQDRERWPLADEAGGGDFAITSQLGFSTIWLYYFSGGGLVEGKYRDGRWDPARVVEGFNSTVVGGDGDGEGGGGGLSTGAKIGVGVGVGVGALLLLAVVAICCVRRRRARATAAAAAAGPPWPQSGMGEGGQHGLGVGQDGGGWGGMVYRDSHMSQAPTAWDQESKAMPMTPPPRELESPNLASELPHYVHQSHQRGLVGELA